MNSHGTNLSDSKAKSSIVRPSPKPAIGLFIGLSEGDIAEFMRTAVVRRFAKDEIIVREGERGTHLFLLRTGSVDYYKVTPEGRQVLVIRLTPGDTFGLGTLLAQPVEYLCTAKALRETEAYSWEHHRVRKFVKDHPRLAENALRISLDNIRLYSERHIRFLSRNAEDRLCRTLALLAVRTGRGNAGHLEVQITNEDLASLADLGSFTVSRVLNKWARKGAIKKGRGKIIIHRPERMLDRA